MTSRHPSWNRLIGFSPLLEAACACGAGGGFRDRDVASGLRAGRRVQRSGFSVGGRFARRCATAAPALTAAEGSAVLWAEPSPRERTAQEQWHPMCPSYSPLSLRPGSSVVNSALSQAR